jgi:quinohemoprotein ethanol dehydrogenase
MSYGQSLLYASAGLALGGFLGLAACDAPTSALPEASTAGAELNTDRIIAAASTPEEWLSYGGGYEEQRHSLLDQITPENVGDLDVAWTYDLDTSRGVEATPIVVDGVMYVTGAWSVLYAIDARTGEELWVYDPEVSGEDAIKGCCDVINRGVAVYRDKVFLGVFDGRLEALDRTTGELVWSTVTVDQSQPYTITGAPRVAKGMVLIGNAGGELGVRGYLNAYDAETGELIWRFYTVPNPEKQPDGAISDDALATLANATWGDTGEWTSDGGGGTVWDSIIYDAENDQIIFGIGNGSPWNAKARDPEGNGDNLFLSSIMAVDADTGTYRWHFQTTPRDQWDYTATQSLILADLPLGENGAKRRVVMQAPKNGFFYVLDAATGEYLSGEAFVPMTWASGLDKNGRPIETPEARATEAGMLLTPGVLGAHNWHPMAFNPDTGLAYIPAQVIPVAIRDDLSEEHEVLYWNTHYDFAFGIPLDYPPELIDGIRAANRGFLLAWDPVTQSARWSVEHDGPWSGGILSTTTGIVFQGTNSGQFSAYNAATGKKLWTQDVKSGVAAAPSTYEIDDEQYVAVATGWGTAWALAAGHDFDAAVPPVVGKVVAFKLGGDGVIENPPIVPIDRTPKAERFGDERLLVSGLQAYSENCLVCHGPFAMSSGVLPDLRWSSTTADRELWNDIVLDGMLSDRGMVGFDRQLTPEMSNAIRAYVIEQAHLAVERDSGAGEGANEGE